MGKLSGKVALVTGASRGVGRAIALELAELGADSARYVDAVAFATDKALVPAP